MARMLKDWEYAKISEIRERVAAEILPQIEEAKHKAAELNERYDSARRETEANPRYKELMALLHGKDSTARVALKQSDPTAYRQAWAELATFTDPVGALRMEAGNADNAVTDAQDELETQMAAEIWATAMRLGAQHAIAHMNALLTLSEATDEDTADELIERMLPE